MERTMDTTMKSTVQSTTTAQSRKFGRLIRRPEAGALGAMVVVYILFAIVTSGAGFTTYAGTVGWLNQSAELGIIAIAVGLLMVAGEFDLSIGSTVAAAGMIVAVGTTIFGIPIWYTILLALLVGAAIGFLNGMIVTRTGLPSFIVTLASNFLIAGATLGLSRLLAGTSTVSVTSSERAQAVFGSQIYDANVSILWWIATAALATWVLSRTVFGNWIYATGGQEQAAQSAGVPTKQVKVILFATTGLAAALVGIITAITYNTGNAGTGQGFVFQAPVVVVIGGIALNGGYGSPLGVVFGTAIFGIISVGIFYTGWSTDWVSFFLGALLLAAVLTNNYFRKLTMRVS